VSDLPKPESYYGIARTDTIPLLPDPLGRVLDIGCGAGATGALLRKRHPERLIGIEIVPEAAATAAEIYDQVLTGPVEQMLEQVEGPLDTILCYDVLEHLVDPSAVLRQVAELAAPGARLHVSVPNVRHFSVAYNIYLRGTFGYTTSGLRDSTHLRWFTPRDIEQLVSDAGFTVVSSRHAPFAAWREKLGQLTGGRSSQFLSMQWQVLATRQS
jgi:2-polyprenyl-3-methyl-5-hydroxy-6-metoxy-1,4-benzoquinol methylase